MNEDFLEKLKAHCPNGFITRGELKQLTGGFITARTMTMLDHMGKGIKNRTVISGRTVYHIDDFIDWFRNNVEFDNFEKEEAKNE